MLKVLLTEHRLMERNHAALQQDLASCQGELAARCDDLEVLKDAHAAAEAQVTQQSQDIQVCPRLLPRYRIRVHPSSHQHGCPILTKP